MALFEKKKKKVDNDESPSRIDVKGEEEFSDFYDLKRYSSASILKSDSDFKRKNDIDLSEIRTRLNRSFSDIKEKTGGDILSFLSNVAYQGKISDKKTGEEKQKTIIDIKRLIENSELSGFNELFLSEVDRVTLYRDYERIMETIPQMSIAVKTIVDSILSPDDFTKLDINGTYTGRGLSEDNKERIQSNIKFLIKKYRLEERAPKIIMKALIKGDYFLACLSLKDEFEKILNENSGETYFKRKEFADSGIKIDSSMFKGNLTNILKENFKEEFFEDEKEATEENLLESSNILLEEITTKINENVSFHTNSMILLEDEMKLKDNFSTVESSSEQKKEMNIRGSVLKILDPERVIKLRSDDITYGYLYIESLPGQDLDLNFGLSPTSSSSGTTTLEKVLTDKQKLLDLNKKRFIYNLFVRGISKKIKKDFLEKNTEFADVIHNLLKQDYLVNKKIRIIFLKREEVHHFGLDDGENTYYDSLFRPILFTAKLYISVLVNRLLYQLVRAPSKRLFFVDVGMDLQEGNVINDFIRDVKSKEFRIGSLTNGDINNVLSFIGGYNDIFIPTVDNTRPIEVETMEDNSPAIEDELTDFFLRTMTGGIGFPRAYYSDMENVQFAKSLSQENARFLRDIIRKQKIFGIQFSLFLRNLYINEYPNEIVGYSDKEQGEVKIEESSTSIFLNEKAVPKKKKSDTSNNSEDDVNELFKINPEFLAINFPSPSYLNATNLNEQIGSFQTIIDFITAMSVGDEDMAKAGKLKGILAREFVKNIDWGMVDDALKQLSYNMEKDKVTGDSSEGLGMTPNNMGDDMGGEPTPDEGMEGDTGGEDMGDEGGEF